MHDQPLYAWCTYILTSFLFKSFVCVCVCILSKIAIPELSVFGNTAYYVLRRNYFVLLSLFSLIFANYLKSCCFLRRAAEPGPYSQKVLGLNVQGSYSQKILSLKCPTQQYIEVKSKTWLSPFVNTSPGRDVHCFPVCLANQISHYLVLAN